MEENNIVKDELIGRKVTIKECADPTWKHIKGIVIDETKNTFLIKTDHGNKKIAKKTAIFEFEGDDEKIVIDGKKIAHRPEDRIKKVR